MTNKIKLDEIIINRKCYRNRSKNIKGEKEIILITLARILKSEIKELSRLNEDFYPGEEKLANESVGENWLPKSLLKFMEILVLSKKALASVVYCKQIHLKLHLRKVT